MAQDEKRSVNELTLTDGNDVANNIVIKPQAVGAAAGGADGSLIITVGGTTYYIAVASALT